MSKLVKGGKASLYEGGIKVPFIFWGGNVENNLIIEEPIVMHDLAPTLLSVADTDTPFTTDGKNWKDIVLSQDNSEIDSFKRPLYWENFHGHGCQAALLEYRYKVIKSKCDQQDYKIEVYDLTKDPIESNDLSAQADMKPIIEKAKQLFISEHIPFQESGILF